MEIRRILQNVKKEDCFLYTSVLFLIMNKRRSSIHLNCQNKHLLQQFVSKKSRNSIHLNYLKKTLIMIHNSNFQRLLYLKIYSNLKVLDCFGQVIRAVSRIFKQLVTQIQFSALLRSLETISCRPTCKKKSKCSYLK